MLYDRLKVLNVEMRGCDESLRIIPSMKRATDEDWSTEYLDLVLGIKIVKDVDEAIDHISRYGTKHSESIITNNYQNAMRFTSEIDAAAVYVNASTRFTDGGEFGFGGEIGISTQKLHARGPVGLNELTSYKYVIHGEGQIRS
jgi:glutamate-5-semialdehyde dehydrogenase